MTSRYAIFGQPIAHSLSPLIHAAFGAQLGIAIDYRPIEVGRDDFVRALEAFAHDDGHGANVTLPLKEAAFALCMTLSDRARRAGSVNTLIRDGDAWHGDSTDGTGLLRDLHQRHAFDPRNCRILLLGAGGAARAAAFAFADADVRTLVIANRTPQRAQALAEALEDAPRVRAATWDEALERDDFDLVVNATSAGHGNRSFNLRAPVFARQTLCCDLSYGNAAQPFLDWARAAGATRITDGLGMLIEQAAESFAIWHGQRPDTASVYAAMRAAPESRSPADQIQGRPWYIEA